MSEVLKLSQVRRTYKQGGRELEVLRGIDLTLNPAEVAALVGPSGSGKTTLLQIAGLLDRPTAGNIHINGVDASRARDAERTQLRGRHIGFVYQFHQLLPEFSALENVMIPQLINGKTPGQAKQRAALLLESMGLGKRLSHRPARLSGGEQQRVAIARALANAPALLLADEPTGNLDPETAEEVFMFLMQAVREYGLAALIATHNYDLAARMHRTVRLEHGVAI